MLDVVVPVYNEQAALADSVRRLHRYLPSSFPYPVRITIADNASTDDTPRDRRASSPTNSPTSGSSASSRRAAAARCTQVWSTSDATVLAYMDVDLSTDLAALPRWSRR